MHHIGAASGMSIRIASSPCALAPPRSPKALRTHVDGLAVEVHGLGHIQGNHAAVQAIPSQAIERAA